MRAEPEEVGRELRPAGCVARGRAGDGAIDQSFLQRGTDILERDDRRGSAEGGDQRPEILVAHPDLETRQIRQAGNGLLAEKYLRPERPNAQQLCIEMRLQRAVQDGRVSLHHGTGGAEVSGYPQQINAQQLGLDRGVLQEPQRYQVEGAALEHEQLVGVFDAQLIGGRVADVERQAGRGRQLLEKRLFLALNDAGDRRLADHLQADAIELLPGRHESRSQHQGQQDSWPHAA